MELEKKINRPKVAYKAQHIGGLTSSHLTKKSEFE